MGDIQLGGLQVVDLGDAAQLAKWTRQCLDNTFKAVDVPNNPICPPTYQTPSSQIKHVVYITKENRTYDEVLGQIPGAKGDSSLARFGLRTNLQATAERPALQQVDVTPNHHAIARRWAFSDNFTAILMRPFMATTG